MTRKRLMAILILGGLFFSFLIYYLIENFENSFIENFLSNFLSTLMGLIIGIPIALWVSNIQENSIEKERKTKILLLLYSELKDNLQSLRWSINEDKNFYENYGYLSLKNVLWKAFSDGGEIEWIKDLNLLDRISIAYFEIDRIESLINWTVKVGPSKRANFNNINSCTWNELLYMNMEDVIDHIQEALKLIEKNIDIIDKAELTQTFIHG